MRKTTDSAFAFHPLSAREKDALAKLKQQKYRKLTERFLLEGSRLVEEAIHAHASLEMVVFDALHAAKFSSLIAQAKKSGIRIAFASEKDFRRLTETVHAQGVLAVARRKPCSLLELFDVPLVVALDSIADPGNLGTIIRSCDWFGVTSLLLSRASVEETNSKVVRASMGSIFRTRIARYLTHEELFDASRQAGYAIAALDSKRGESIHTKTLPEKTVLLFGSEATGLSDEILTQCDYRLTIPGRSASESLNLAIAHGIALSVVTNRR